MTREDWGGNHTNSSICSARRLYTRNSSGESGGSCGSGCSSGFASGSGTAVATDAGSGSTTDSPAWRLRIWIPVSFPGGASGAESGVWLLLADITQSKITRGSSLRR